MRLAYTVGYRFLACAGAGLILHGCTPPSPPPAAELGGWPPTKSTCVRNDMVDVRLVGDELTRVHGDYDCVTQTTGCTWGNVQTKTFQTDAIGNMLWLQPASRLLSIADQNDIVARARWAAHLQQPAGKYLYRLTFDSGVYTSGTTSTGSVGTVGTTAHYGRCEHAPGPGATVPIDDGPPPAK